jgi:hypothetical protein
MHPSVASHLCTFGRGLSVGCGRLCYELMMFVPRSAQAGVASSCGNSRRYMLAEIKHRASSCTHQKAQYVAEPAVDWLPAGATALMESMQLYGTHMLPVGVRLVRGCVVGVKGSGEVR